MRRLEACRVGRVSRRGRKKVVETSSAVVEAAAWSCLSFPFLFLFFFLGLVVVELLLLALVELSLIELMLVDCFLTGLELTD